MSGQPEPSRAQPSSARDQPEPRRAQPGNAPDRCRGHGNRGRSCQEGAGRAGRLRRCFTPRRWVTRSSDQLVPRGHSHDHLPRPLSPRGAARPPGERPGLIPPAASLPGSLAGEGWSSSTWVRRGSVSGGAGCQGLSPHSSPRPPCQGARVVAARGRASPASPAVSWDSNTAMGRGRPLRKTQ